MERLLTLWVNDLNQKRIPLTRRAIAAEVRSLFDETQQKGGNETFNASKGWFARFKQHSQIHCIKISGEAAGADIEAIRSFTAEFKKIIEDNDFPPDLVFNVDETGLYWEKLPSRTYILREEKSAHGFKASKDRLTLLLGGNASRTLKLKPLQVYHSETPRVMAGILKSRFPVIWVSNRKAWITLYIFSERYSKHLAILCYSFAIKTICAVRLLCCLTTLQGIHQTWKMLSQSSRLR